MTNCWYKSITVLVLVAVFSGCSTMSNGRGWGQDVGFGNWNKIKRAAVNAATDPETWVPALGAVVMSMGDLDKEVSEWASDETPIYGSQEDARDASDDLKDSLQAITILTAIAAPSGDNAGEWASSKAKGLLVEIAAGGLAQTPTSFLKDNVNRTRPDGSNERSFPSGHATQAYAYSTLSSRNVNAMRFSNTTKKVTRIGLKTLAAGTAWVRIEARKHYPSDVLAGAALAHFLSAFIHDAFMGIDQNTIISVTHDTEKNDVAGRIALLK